MSTIYVIVVEEGVYSDLEIRLEKAYRTKEAAESAYEALTDAASKGPVERFFYEIQTVELED